LFFCICRERSKKPLPFWERWHVADVTERAKRGVEGAAPYKKHQLFSSRGGCEHPPLRVREILAGRCGHRPLRNLYTHPQRRLATYPHAKEKASANCRCLLFCIIYLILYISRFVLWCNPADRPQAGWPFDGPRTAPQQEWCPPLYG